MAYVRWDEDSEVYCYHSSLGGYETILPTYNRDGTDFDHPDAGRIFNDKTLEEMRDRLVKFRDVDGLKVPDRVFERIDRDLNIERP